MMSAFKNMLTTMLPMEFRKKRLRLYIIASSLVSLAACCSLDESMSTISFRLRSIVRAKRFVMVSSNSPTPEINATGVIEL